MIEYNSSMMLNETAVVHPETLKMQLEFNYIFDYMEMIQAKYAWVEQYFAQKQEIFVLM